MAPLPPEEIERLRDMRRSGMTVRDIEAKAQVSRQTVEKYTSNLYDSRVGFAYKAPKAERYTVTRIMPDGGLRSVTSDTLEQAEKVCNWQLAGDVAKGIAEDVAKNRLGDGGAHAMKRNGPGGAYNTDPALNQTT